MSLSEAFQLSELSVDVLKSYIKKSVDSRPSKDTKKSIKRRDMGWKALGKVHDKEDNK